MSKLRMRYQTIEFGDKEIHLRTLRDKQEFSDDDQEAEKLGVYPAHWSLFGVLWESGEILARVMQGRDLKGLRVLEVGCGIGLASLILQQEGVDITATDHHPEAQGFLDANTALNDLKDIPFVRTGWDENNDELGEFDLIVGSDLIYEEFNLDMLSDFISRHGKATSDVLIVDPGRGMQGKFTTRMAALGYQQDSRDLAKPEITDAYNGRVLCYSRKA